MRYDSAPGTSLQRADLLPAGLLLSPVTGMMCDGCVAGVTAALKAVPKVVRVTSVDLASGVATCEVKAETMVRV